MYSAKLTTHTLSGSYTAPDGWVMRWATQCPDCPNRRDCRHDCGHPGSVRYAKPDGTPSESISGIVDDSDVARLLNVFKAAHTGQMSFEFGA